MLLLFCSSSFVIRVALAPTISAIPQIFYLRQWIKIKMYCTINDMVVIYIFVRYMTRGRRNRVKVGFIFGCIEYTICIRKSYMGYVILCMLCCDSPLRYSTPARIYNSTNLLRNLSLLLPLLCEWRCALCRTAGFQVWCTRRATPICQPTAAKTT